MNEHRCPHRWSRPDRAHPGRVAGQQGYFHNSRRPAGRRLQHVARRRRQRPHARGARRPRRRPAIGQGGHPGAAVHHPGRSAHADPDRLQHAADRIPVLVDGSAVDDGAAAPRPAGRARRLRGPAQDADLRRAGRRRRHGDVRRRRHRPGPLRGGRRRYPQQGARAGRHRLRGRPVRRVVPAGRRPAHRRRAGRRGDPVLGDCRADGGGAASRRHLPHRRAGSPTHRKNRPSSSSRRSSTSRGPAPGGWSSRT